ncbi:atherin-like [Phacochoerus africanus]|uniref:atherin-like n=1 Tax=Phacochoerus africanus TaxID=41426 RepID=UPI001FD9088E|nr:atherin-like [Phacochoerus africanus]
MLPLAKAAAAAGGGQLAAREKLPAARPEAAADPPGALPADTGFGKQESPASWPSPPAPALPGSNSPFSFRPSAAFRLPLGPFKNGTAAASVPARRLAEPPPPATRQLQGST